MAIINQMIPVEIKTGFDLGKESLFSKRTKKHVNKKTPKLNNPKVVCVRSNKPTESFSIVLVDSRKT